MVREPKQAVSQEFVKTLRDSAVLAVKIGKMEQEYRREYALAVKYQQEIWYPTVKKMMIGLIVTAVIGFIASAITGYGSKIILKVAEIGVPVILFGSQIWFIVLQFTGKHHKVFMRLEKEISQLVKHQWIPNKKALDKMAEHMDICDYRNEYANVSEIDIAMRKLKRWKKVARQMKTIGVDILKDSLCISAVIGVGMVALAGATVGMVNSASSDFGSGGSTKWIERTEYANGDIREREI